jgi:hypothetical protein
MGLDLRHRRPWNYFCGVFLVSLASAIRSLEFGSLHLYSWWMVFDWPQTARFLTVDERHRVVYRLAKDKQGSAGTEDYHKLHVMAALKDWKTYS